MKKIVFLLCFLSVLPACSDKQEDLKSPCVGGKDSPCDRRPVNDWWHPAQG